MQSKQNSSVVRATSHAAVHRACYVMMFEQSENLHYSPVLNFVQRNKEEGIDDETIKRFGAEFFDCEVIVIAKKWLGLKLDPDAPFQKRTGTKAPSSHLGDILEMLRKGDSDCFTIPTFVIRSPSEVPVIPASAYSALLSKVNELNLHLKTISNQFESYSANFPPLPQPGDAASSLSSSHATVIVSNLPQTVCNPKSRKEFLDQLSGHESVSSVRPRGDKLYVNIEKSVISDFCNSISAAASGATTKTVLKRHLGIARGIPEDFDIAGLNSYPGVTEATRFGSSQTIKLEFSDTFAKGNAIKNGLKIGYEIFRVYDFISVPRCCFKCRSPDHMMKDCTSPVDKCARCAGNHTATKETPCQNSPKCANCNGDHTSFSLKCPVLKSRVSSSARK